MPAVPRTPAIACSQPQPQPPGSAPQFSLDSIILPLVVPSSAPAVSPPPSYQAAVADKTAKALARGKQAAAKVRLDLVRRLPAKTPNQIKAQLTSLKETVASLTAIDRPLKTLVKLAVLVGVNPFGA